MAWRARMLGLSLVAVLVWTDGRTTAGGKRPSAGAGLPASARVVAAPAALAGIRTRIARLVDDREVPSFAIAVAHRRQVVWQEAFGFSDPERRISASPDTVYTLASLGKAITATAVMRLATAGHLDLDRPVNAYLRGANVRVLEGDAGALTVRALLLMRGGVPHLWQHYWSDEPRRPASMNDLIARYGVSVSPPGQHEAYSNLSYGILQQLVEDVSGRAFERYVREQVFVPLGMRHSSVRGMPSTDHLTARPHMGSTAVPYWFSQPEGGAGFRSSVTDLVLFGMFHLGHQLPGQQKILSDAALREMHGAPVDGGGYQMGWGVVRDQGGATLFIANGGIVGAISMLLLVPEADLVVAALTNTSLETRHTDLIAHDVASHFLNGYKKALAVPGRYVEQPYAVSGELLGEWRGEVRLPERSVALSFWFFESGTVEATVGAEAPRLATGLIMEQDTLKGTLDSALPRVGDLDRPHDLHFSLRREANRLYGSMMAQSRGSRPSFGLPFYVQLTKVAKTGRLSGGH